MLTLQAPDATPCGFPSPGGSSGLDGTDGEHAVEGAGHAAALDLFHVPVVGEAGPTKDRLDGRGPDVAGLDGLDPAQGEHVGKVHEPELELVDLQPGVGVLAAHV